MWWNIAASFGDKDAITYVAVIANRMTPKQISLAQEMVSKCRDANYKKCE